MDPDRTLLCPPREDLGAFAGGRLPDVEFAAVAAHLEACGRCQAALTGLSAAPDTLADAIRRHLGRAAPAAADDTVDASGPAAPGTATKTAPPLPPTQTVQQVLPGPGGPVRDAPEYPYLDPPDRPGDLGRLGPYRVLRLLGRGGMGCVFLGHDDGLQRPVAVKVMRPEAAANPDARDRFLREGRSAAAVKSDHVVTIYHVGEANGTPFLGMELLEGCALDEWLKGRPGPVPAKAVARVARDVLRGLAAAHEKGLVHRDIKPANLWVEKGGRVKVLDFGLTRPEADHGNLTRDGAVVGTPAYMAPEQAAGQKVDARADLWSVGVVLYRMATGANPFQRDTVYATLNALATVTPPPAHTLSELPPPLARLMDRLMSRDLAGRPASARAALAEWAEDEKAPRPPEARPVPPPLPVPATVADTQAEPGPPPPAPIARRRRKWPVVLAALLLLGLGTSLAPTVIRVLTPKGELVVVTDDPNMEVLVRQDGVAVTDRTKERTFILKARDGEVDFFDPGSGARAGTKRFQIERGGRAVVVVTAKPPLPPPPEVNPGMGEPPPKSGPGVPPPPVNPVPDLPGDWTAGEPHRFGSKDKPARGLAVSADGRLAVIAEPGTARVVETVAGTTAFNLRPSAHTGAEVLAEFSPDGKRLVTGCSDHLLCVWDVPAGKVSKGPLDGPKGLRRVVFSPSGDRFVVMGQDRSIRGFETDAGRQLWTQAEEGESGPAAGWSADGKEVFVYVENRDSAVRLDAATGGGVGRDRGLIGVPPAAKAFLADGRRLLVGQRGEKGGPTRLRLIDLASGLDRWAHPQAEDIDCLAVGAGGRLAAGGRQTGARGDEPIRVWESAGGTEVHRLPGHPKGVTDLRFAAGGRVLLSTGADGTARLWKMPDHLFAAKAPGDGSVAKPSEERDIPPPPPPDDRPKPKPPDPLPPGMSGTGAFHNTDADRRLDHLRKGEKPGTEDNRANWARPMCQWEWERTGNRVTIRNVGSRQYLWVEPDSGQVRCTDRADGDATVWEVVPHPEAAGRFALRNVAAGKLLVGLKDGHLAAYAPGPKDDGDYWEFKPAGK